MTNEEAVVILKNAIKKPNTEDGYLGQALTMAIKALEQLQEKPEYIDIWNVGAILRNVPEQPDICKIYGGACGYPIEACSECLKHEGWRPSKEQTTRWIPCSERLPEEHKWVLCSCRASIYEVLMLTNKGWEDGYDKVYMQGFVVAWMPLPEEPPKAESEEKQEQTGGEANGK